MKVNDIIKKIDDFMLYIRIVDINGYVMFEGKKNNSKIVYNNKIKNLKVKRINVQYDKGVRILILEV